METRRSTRLIQKENSKPTNVFKETKQNALNDVPKSKVERNGSTSPIPNKTLKSSYFDPDFSEESGGESDSPPVKRRARIINRSKKLVKSRKRYDSEDESSSEEFVKKPKSITEILQSKSELKLSSDESDSSEESPPKRNKKSEGSPVKQLNTSAKIKSDSDSSDEFVKPNKPSNSIDNIIKSEPSKESEIKEEEAESSSSQAEYFDFTALVNKVKANENNISTEEIKIEAESKKSEKSTPKKSKKIASKSEIKPEDKSDLEVFELLAMGEDTDMSATDIKKSVAQSSQDTYEIPKQVEIVLDAPALKKKKHTDLEMTLRRRLNFIRRENQVYVHKVSILCWIAHGMYVNSILNSPELLSLALSLLPSDKCYPAKRMDMNYLNKLIEWFAKKIKLSKEPIDNRKKSLFISLEAQFQKLEAENKSDLCFMFICIIRALGIKCRLIVNLNVVPIKPTSDQLLPINAKKDASIPTTTKKMLEKENSTKSNKRNVKSKAESSKTSSKDTKEPSHSEKKTENRGKKETPKKDQSSSAESKRSSRSKSEKSDKKGTPAKEERSSHFQREKSKDPSSSKDTSKQKSVSTPEKSNEKNSHVTKRSSRSQSAKSNESKSSTNSHHDESASKKSNKYNVDNESVRKSARSKSSSLKDQSKYFEEEKSTRKSERVTNSSYFAKNTEKSEVSKSKDSSKSDKFKDSKKSTHKSKAIKKAEPENLVEEMSTSDDSEEDDTDATFIPTKKKKIDRRVLSSEEDLIVEEKSDTKNKQNKLNYWLEVFLEAEEQWTCVDIAKKSYHCTQQLYNQATHPVRYVIAFNSDQTIKDVTRRYVPQYLSVTRKLRVDDAWWKITMHPFKPPQDPQNREEDEALEKILEEQPLPTSISEYKNHPLYALKRHLLKFQAIYPPDAPPLGFVKGEPVYSRLCVVQLHGREMWIKEAKVVKMGEKPYKIVKGRQKKDKFGTDEGPKDLELFGLWQTEDYDPPTAENGIVPRNSFGNVELFKPCMLPKGTVYLQIPGLMRIANKLNIDCAAAITGFEYSTNGWSYPVKDGFVVCEEYKDILLDAFNQEVEEAEKKERQKREERVYANWKRLIKGMFIREKLKRKYNFGDPGTSSDQDKSESK